MDIAQITLADTWGMHSGGWWILGAIVMMVMMGGMMWMMMRGMGSKRSSTPSETPRPTESPHATESPVEVLDRRFAEGEISVEDYRERREALTVGAAREPAGVAAVKRDAAPEATRKEEP